MNTRFKLIASISALMVLVGCNKDPSSTLTNKFGGGMNTEVHDDLIKPARAMPLNCPPSTMVVLIGSSESMSQIESWNVVSTSLQDENTRKSNSEALFQSSVAKAHNNLLKSLARDPGSNCKTNLMYVAIIDGPGMKDSEILTTNFNHTNGSWKSAPSKNWTFAEDKLIASTSKFELDTSRDIKKILEIMTSSSYEKLNNANELTGSGGTSFPDQITYIIKAHGGRVSLSKEILPDLENLKKNDISDLAPNSWEPAILADTNGPNGTLKSPIFSPRWNKEDIEKVFGPLDDSNDKFAGETGEDSASESSYDTAGEPDENTAGKALAFSEKIIDISTDTSSGRARFGSYATYLKPHTNGIHQIKFPVARKKQIYVDLPSTPIYGTGRPTLELQSSNLEVYPKNLIILDSCFGSESIKSALDYKGPRPDRSNTVILASVAPIYIEFLDYGALGFSELLKLPALLERLKENKSLTREESDLVKNMVNGTLSSDSTLTKTQNKKLTIWAD